MCPESAQQPRTRTHRANSVTRPRISSPTPSVPDPALALESRIDKLHRPVHTREHSARALFSQAARLSSVSLVVPAHALGTDTETAVQSGIVIGAAAQAEGLVRRIVGELRAEDPGLSKVPIVGTGGLVREIARATNLFDALDPDLTVRGIYQIWEHRAKKREG